MTQVSASSAELLQGYAEDVQAFLEEWKIPGAAIGVVKDDEVIFASGFGQRDREQGLAVTPQTVFPIASCTKAFVAMALAILVDEGKLEWDKPVRDYLPDFKLADEIASERLTTRDILSHRSGLPGHDLAVYNSSLRKEELLKRMQYLELNHDIRTAWQYNNLMYAVSGCVLEAISGQSWHSFIRERILTPLGMSSTSFSSAELQQAPDYASPYTLRNDEVKRTRYYTRLAVDGPAGAMNSNVEDMTKWLRCLLKHGKYGDGEQRLVSEEQFAQLTGPQMIMPKEAFEDEHYTEESSMCYALGWWVYYYRGHRFVQHSGGIDGFSVLTTFLPDDNLGTVVLTNREAHVVATHGIFTYSAVDRLLGLDLVPWNERTKRYYTRLKEQAEQQKKQEESKRVADAPLSHPISDYVGEYEHPGYGTFSILPEGQGIKGLLNGLEYSLSHFHYDVFQAELARFDATFNVSFSTDLDGKITYFSAPLEPSGKPIVFKRAKAAAQANGTA
ncbi:serine hydrolase [Ktedonosporobacter rubrisoli]|uniref:Serine hydrolase n=1 Tax=Ktedonosporobacter rubrisoli TaxID=2509675 RepID=A0A4P6JZA9_KTERU|nr:serine hydrolase [Ktedonosporobacter rubrisoli]QBD80780.1 serine hydrolase [Ktedonosporobacter rubrisoli]